MFYDLPEESKLTMRYSTYPGNKYRTKRELCDQDWKSQAAHGYGDIPKDAIVEFKGFTRNFYGTFARVTYKGNLYYVDYAGIEWSKIIDEEEEKEIKEIHLLGCSSCKHFISNGQFFCKFHECALRSRYEQPCTDFERE